ncbi:GNAT family N-acetyltransferase [Vibrio sp. HN007]|uniref:GNAT family N-acetyltransferase n=1 Tax=Vibrio iocasae TaxID=3098914 RepID=UPI0035D3DAD3
MSEVKPKVFRLDIESHQQRSDMQKLFVEYSSNADANIKENIVEKLCELLYFIGFIAYLGEKPAGFAVCFESFSSYRCKKVLNIHDFMISEAYRGKGYGKVLLKGVEAFARENDYLKITLEVDDDNHSAQKLYSRCGFEDHQVVLKGLLHWQKYLVE